MLVGDFNTDANNAGDFKHILEFLVYEENKLNLKSQNEFDFLLNIMDYQSKVKLKNIYHFHNEMHPITFGRFVISEDGKKVPIETVLTVADENVSAMSVDYMFEVIPASRKNKTRLQIKDKSSQVEEFKIQHAKLTHLSDHVGISCLITKV